MRSPLLALVCLALLGACKSTPAQTTPPPPPPVACTDSSPCALTAGTAYAGDIATVGQVDVYTLAAPANSSRTIVKIQLSNMAPVSPVKLVFLLETSDGATVLATRGPQTGTGAQSLTGYFLIPSSASYRILVRDSLNTHSDSLNGYSLTATLLNDPDSGEPDDTPAMARPLALNQTGSMATGVIASAGDIDLCQFTVPSGGALVDWTVAQAATSGALQLQARLLLQSATNPNDLLLATPVLETDATGPGAAVIVNVVRYLPAGSYLIELDDLSGQQADPTSRWTTGVQQVPDPDPNEQTSRNDTAATATRLSAGSTLQGAIGSQGDVDWYEVDLPAVTTAELLELKLDPQDADSQLELTWAAGALLTTPVDGCDQSCGPSEFCVAGNCAYLEHANHHFQSGEVAPQTVRIRHLGAAQTIRVVVEDFGDLRWSTDLYAISATVLAEPDPNEQTELNDTIDAGTQVAYLEDGGGGLQFTGGGAISSWDSIDGLTTAETFADVDWYQLQLPPRILAPPCPLPDAGELPDGGFDDAGDNDAGLPDGGLCTPNPIDGGAVYYPRPDYGFALYWQNPPDGSYKLGLQGTAAIDGGTACLFSLDQQFAHAVGSNGTGFSYGDQPGDLCFCVAGEEADNLWVRLEAAHRSESPAPAVYSTQQYAFSLNLNPAGLQLACDGGCAPMTQPSQCPGD